MIYAIYDPHSGVVSHFMVLSGVPVEGNVPDGMAAVVTEREFSGPAWVESGSVYGTDEVAPSEQHVFDYEGKRWVLTLNEEEKGALEIVEFQKQRSALYPPLSELADALYWKERGNPDLYEAYIAKCDDVKTAFPKPTK